MNSLLVLTQPWPRVERLAEQLWQADIPNLAIPFSKIEPEFNEPLDLQAYDWVVVVSPSAAECVLALARPYEHERPMPRFACVGPGSLSALREGLDRLAWPDPEIHWPQQAHDAENLLAAPFWGDIAGAPVLLARASKTRTPWAALFATRHARLTELALYRQQETAPDWVFAMPRLQRFIEQKDFESIAWYVSQESVARRLIADVRNLPLGHVTQRDLALVPHPRIKDILERLGWARVEVIHPGADGLVSVMKR